MKTSLLNSVQLPDGRAFLFWEDQTEYHKVYHVSQLNPKASDTNSGTEELPWLSLAKAADVLRPGDKVLVHEGLYREKVSPARGGESHTQMIWYCAAPEEKVVLKGSIILNGPFNKSTGLWKQDTLVTWSVELPLSHFAGYNPFSIPNLPECYRSYGHEWTKEETQRFQLKRGQVFYKGKRLQQVFYYYHLSETLDAFWVEEPGDRIHIRLQNDFDPNLANEGDFEITLQEQIFAPKKVGLGFIRVSGFVMEHCADGIPVPQRAMLSTMRGHEWIIEDNTIRWANGCGIDIGNQHWNYKSKPENGSHIVRRNTITHCGISGLSGPGGVDHSLIEDNLIEYIGWHDLEHIYECAGIKFHTCEGLLIRRNVVRHLKSACGLWLDVRCKNNRVTENVFADIETLLAGAYLELSYHRNCFDQNIFWNLRDDPRNKPPKDGIPGGMGLAGDCSDHIWALHNFFGNIQGHFAVAFHLAQKERIMEGRVGLSKGHWVSNNLFADCNKKILLSRAESCQVQGNWYDRSRPGGDYWVEFPAPAAILNVEAWKEWYHFDLQSRTGNLQASFDEEKLILHLIWTKGRESRSKKDQIPAFDLAMNAESPPELGENLPDLPGPWCKEKWRLEGEAWILDVSVRPELKAPTQSSLKS